MELSEHWVAVPADEDTRRTFADDDVDVATWQPIDVPGHWRSSPAFAEVDGPVLYRTEFDLDAAAVATDDGDRRWWLRFDGLFYQGDVWFDGAYLGDTEGYFFPHTFEISEQVAQRSAHVLGVEAACSPGGDHNITGSFQHSDTIDPAWNPGGIWRPVHVVDTGPVRIARLAVRCVEADESRAVVAFVAELDALDAVEVTLAATVGPVDHAHELTLAAGANAVEWTVTIDRPRLWWPHRLGSAHTEPVTVEVRLGDGRTSDRRSLRTGLRTVTMRNWIVSVNGERLFVKGATQGPTRAALADATEEECRRDVDLAVDAGLDLLRIHAHVARPETYAAADDAGLLLWQDFPLRWEYKRHIRKQAVRQATEMVTTLGHHPSIALWCAHDEPYDSGAGGLGLVARQQLPSWNRTVLDRAVKRAIAAADPTRTVVAHSGVPPHLPRLSGTDSHIAFGWEVGDDRDLAGFARAMPSRVRFPSRLGTQSLPDSDDFVDAASWPDLDWERLERDHGLRFETLTRHVPVDGHDYESWRTATQTYQAEVVRRQVETLRRLKYRPTGGFAVAGFADADEAISTAVVDHRRRPKPAYEALRLACAPVIVVADRAPTTVCEGDALALDVHVVSDRRIPVSGEVVATVSWTDDDGEQRQTWRFRGDVDADACARIGTLQFEVPTTDEVVVTIDGHVGDDPVSNRYRYSVHRH